MDGRQVGDRLGGLSLAARAALAASVAGRLLPYFRRFHEETGQGDPAVLRSALDGVWDRLEHGAALDVVTVGVACMEQAFVAADFGFALAGTRAWEAWRVVNGAATPLAENAVHAAWAAAAACHVAVHGRVTETLHCLRYGRDAALAEALSRRKDALAESDPLVEKENRRQLRDLDMLERSGPTARVLAELRTPAI
ncbi:DUF416 family protein [Actinoallomurus iriomotensis]|uniref:DUF416 family protein n=1 Tax=Actinoallomurus iriomotensis TaxID=478107 RepID=A0A9W6VMB8_9ACTN|nr:DUF416 family protein [Actinoallomurus iriomotensis]GLY77438.1 hypothetical protein Airi01_057050 [Actinoallomurus iriomotensis]GLY89619.1 hypothetical protein Airi02_075480 [Actinoallomurus iriomotensis]